MVRRGVHLTDQVGAGLQLKGPDPFLMTGRGCLCLSTGPVPPEMSGAAPPIQKRLLASGSRTQEAKESPDGTIRSSWKGSHDPVGTAQATRPPLAFLSCVCNWAAARRLPHPPNTQPWRSVVSHNVVGTQDCPLKDARPGLRSPYTPTLSPLFPAPSSSRPPDGAEVADIGDTGSQSTSHSGAMLAHLQALSAFPWPSLG